MSKMRIKARPALEAYIGKRGDICLKQEVPGDEDTVITIPPEDVEQVIDWLQTLAKERRGIPDEQFQEEDEGDEE